MNERQLIGAVGVAILFVLLAVRIPIGVAMAVVAIGGISAAVSVRAGFGVLSSIPFEVVGDWNLSAIPMFLLMGYVAAAADLTKNLFKSARITLSWLPGGLATATVISAALFSSASGSSIATAAVFARAVVPEMLKANYQPALATGAVAAAGTLGALIPPSVLMIVYGITMSTSINSLFLGGVVPGILTAFAFIVYITIRCILNPSLAPTVVEAFSTEEKREAFQDIWPLPVIIVCVIGGIFAGLFTPTEAGAVGATLAIIVALLRRSLDRAKVTDALKKTAHGTATIFIVVVGAALFQRFLGLTGLASFFAELVAANIHTQIGLILAVAVLYLVLGCFLEPVSVMLLTLPILAPVLTHFSVDLVWFGIIVIKLLEMGMVTPPLGLNIFVVKGALDNQVRLGEIFRGAGGFLIADCVTLGLIIAFPILSLWLPSMAR